MQKATEEKMEIYYFYLMCHVTYIVLSYQLDYFINFVFVFYACEQKQGNPSILALGLNELVNITCFAP